MDSELIRPDETAYRLELTAAQLKIVHTALKSLYDDLGREQHDVKTVVAAVLAKLPGEHEIRAIDLSRELGRHVPPGARRRLGLTAPRRSSIRSKLHLVAVRYLPSYQSRRSAYAQRRNVIMETDALPLCFLAG